MYINDLINYLIMLLNKIKYPSSCIYGNVYRSKISKNVIIHRNSYIYDSYFSDNSYCGMNCVIQKAHIGKYVSIGNYVQIINSSHNIDQITTYPKILLGIKGDEFKSENTTIGNDVWIGSGVTILPGIEIGDGAIIGAGAIVTKNVPPYAIYVGNPAKLLRYRFPNNIISRLNKIKWWNLEDKEIKKIINSRYDIKTLIKELDTK